MQGAALIIVWANERCEGERARQAGGEITGWLERRHIVARAIRFSLQVCSQQSECSPRGSSRRDLGRVWGRSCGPYGDQETLHLTSGTSLAAVSLQCYPGKDNVRYFYRGGLLESRGPGAQ